jgi:hypothetical protein
MRLHQLRMVLRGWQRHWRTRRLTVPNAVLKNRHQDRARCFVVGNGPSLKKQDLRPLRKEVVFVCNFFNLHPLCAEIAPRYFCFADPHAFFPGTYNQDLQIRRDEWFQDICAKVPRAEFIVPVEARPAIEQHGFFAGHPVWYIATYGSSLRLGRAGDDLTRCIPQGAGTVAALCIPSALYMGFSTIYLLGCDCNWWLGNLAREDFDAEIEHFYDVNPFDSRASNLKDFGLERELRDLADHFGSFRVLRQYAEGRGARILNATRGGILDVLERVNYEDLVG